MTRADLCPSFFYAVIFSCLAAHAHQEKPRQRPGALILSGRSIPGTAALLYSHARRQSPQDRLRPRPLQEFAHCCQQLRLASSSLTGPDEDSAAAAPVGAAAATAARYNTPAAPRRYRRVRKRRGKGRQPQGLPQPATTGQRATAINASRKRDDLGSTSTCGGGDAARPRQLALFRSVLVRSGWAPHRRLERQQLP